MQLNNKKINNNKINKPTKPNSHSNSNNKAIINFQIHKLKIKIKINNNLARQLQIIYFRLNRDKGIHYSIKPNQQHNNLQIIFYSKQISSLFNKSRFKLMEEDYLVK
jgi:hypothetical protein